MELKIRIDNVPRSSGASQGRLNQQTKLHKQRNEVFSR
jgi:hypothetical protein